MDFLKLCYFDQQVSATSGYNEYEDTFKSPSFALRWGTVLEKSVILPYLLLLKEMTRLNKKK